MERRCRDIGKGQGSQEEIDWNKIYFKLQLYYPNEANFNHDNFAQCPINLVSEALDAIYEKQLSDANLIAAPIANHGILSLQALGVKKKPKSDWINPYPQLIEKHQNKGLVDNETVETFKQLAQSQQIPPFVFNEFYEIAKVIQSQF